MRTFMLGSLFLPFLLGCQAERAEQQASAPAHIQIQARTDRLSEHQLDRVFFGSNFMHVFWDSAPTGIQKSPEIQNPQSWYERLQTDPRVEAFSPLLASSALFNFGKLSASSNLNGCIPAQQTRVTSIAQNLTEGRFKSIAVGGNRIILGEELAKRLGATMNQTILVTVGTHPPVPFKVVGLFATGNRALDRQAYAALDDVQRINGTPNRINEIDVRLKNSRATQKIASDWSKISPDVLVNG